MTYWKCPKCFWVRESKDNVKIVFCNCCLTIMEEYPYDYKKEVEVNGNRGESTISREGS